MTRRRGSTQKGQSELFSRVGRGGETHRTSVRLPAGARQEMFSAMAADGYGLRQKSRFVEDAARAFLARETWEKQELSRHAWKRMVVDMEMVRVARQMTEAVQVSHELHVILWRSSIHAALWGARQDPPVYLEISIASVLRAAILWRMGFSRPE